MPLRTWSEINAGADQLPGLLPSTATPNPEDVKTPELSATDVLAAGFRTAGNVLTAAYDRAWEAPAPHDDPNYDPWPDLKGYEEYAKEFVRAGSKEEVEIIKRRVDEALAALRTTRQAGGWGWTSAIAGGALDPATLASMVIPVAPMLSGATRAERIYAGVTSALALDSAAEAVAQAQDPTRTALDASVRIGAGALLTGAFGTLATKVPKAEFEAMRKQLQADMKAAPERQGGDSVGAMRAGPNLTLDDLEIDTKAGRAIAKTVGRISPLDRVLTSSSKAARILAAEIAEVPYKLKMNFKGKAITALETRSVQRELRQRYGVNQLLDDAFTTYRKRVGDGAVSFEQFKLLASRAGRNNYESDIPEISSLTRTTAKKLFDPDRADLQRYNVLPEEINLMGGKSYFPRMWDSAVVSARGTELRDKFKRLLARNPPDEVLPDGTTKPAAALDDAELKAAVEEIISHIRGTTRGIADISTITIPGQLKRRVLDIPENEFEEFLVNDFEQVIGAYARAMAPQIEARKAGFTKMNFEDELSAVHDDYDALRSNAKSDKAIKALDKEEEAVLRDLRGLILRVTNQVGPKNGTDYEGLIKAARMVRGYNYATKLGGQTLSSFSDYGHIATRYGAVKTNKALAKFLTNIDFNKMTRADAKRMGVAVDWILDSRSSTLAEIGDELGSSKIERATEWATKKFTRVTGMATWNSVMKSLTSALEQDQLVRYIQKMGPQSKMVKLYRGEGGNLMNSKVGGNWFTTDRAKAELYGKVREIELPERTVAGHFAQAGGKPDEFMYGGNDLEGLIKSSQQSGNGLKPFERAKLAEYGLGDEELAKIAPMIEKHADDSEGMWRLRTDLWKDRGAAKAVEQAISKAANIMVIRKGAGDLPLLMNSEAAKTMFQFKSFGMAAVNRILIPVAQGLSHRDAATANGFAMMLALGGLTYAAKEYAAGRVPDMSPGQLSKEALNWSGVLGYLPDVWDPLTMVTPKSIRQDLRFSKFKDVSAMQTLLGPSVGTGADTLAMISGLADGEGVSQRDLHNVRKAFVPMQNVFYLRRIIDALEGEMGEAIGAEGATSDQFTDRITKTEEPKK